MPSEWNMFVKKIYEEGKSKDHNYQFKNALKDASKRKSEMKHSSSASDVKKKRRHGKTVKRGGSRRNMGGSRRHMGGRSHKRRKH